jgi:hypothetical protein
LNGSARLADIHSSWPTLPDWSPRYHGTLYFVVGYTLSRCIISEVITDRLFLLNYSLISQKSNFAAMSIKILEKNDTGSRLVAQLNDTRSIHVTGKYSRYPTRGSLLTGFHRDLILWKCFISAYGTFGAPEAKRLC